MENYTQQQSEFILAGNVNAVPIFRSKRKIRLLIIRSVIVLVLVSFAAIFGTLYDHSADWFAGVFGALFCGLTAIFVITTVAPKLKQSEPAIVLDEKGILWRMNNYEPVRIFWENIASIETLSFRAMNFLVVKVNNGYQLKEGKKGMQSFFMSVNEMTFGSPICFRASTLEVKFNKLYSMVSVARSKVAKK